MNNHAGAVEAAIRASKEDLTEADEPLLQLARTLAAQMDAAGDKPGSRLAGTYLATVRTLLARLGRSPRVDRTTKLSRLRAGRIGVGTSPTSKNRRRSA